MGEIYMAGVRSPPQLFSPSALFSQNQNLSLHGLFSPSTIGLLTFHRLLLHLPPPVTPLFIA